jgi:hypothetical protein
MMTTWNERCMNIPQTDQLQVAVSFLRQIVLQRDMKFIALCATCRAITAFTWPQHWSLSRDRFSQSTSHLTSVISISVLSFNSRITFPELPALRIQNDILWALLVTPVYATCPANLTLFVLAKYTGFLITQIYSASYLQSLKEKGYQYPALQRHQSIICS